MNIELQNYLFNHRNTLWLFKHGLGFVVKGMRSLKRILKVKIYQITKNMECW